ncbi:filamentous hemagglutinin N-terminal domain-containing protein [Achromobacter spanius]|uniref:Filamentous hemagglutinin N-terminal domain-containing protein n=1 Tax=Achromobacter spanius TaxID=217203 RepID=A0AA42LPX3_9BURK|nr:filamentous hemagglutinin N-terminal domain-containing protein [Achromobacter spanius]MDH0737390.1 filamentous hemagglutinin N-terminal domain-containing protein [Achromobacter spanius]
MNRNSRSLAPSARRSRTKKDAALPALSTLAVLIGSLASGGAHANPTGGNVVGGAATIIDRGNGTLDIKQSTGKAIINWKDFSIGANETVNFRQPGGKSVTLNRVVGNDPSAIFGRLNANGTVMLVNPNGVVFGKGARIDVGGLVATTANISDKDFLAGNYKFNQASSKANAAIVNEGTISIKDSGLAALVAPSVRNSGVIEAKLGRVALAGAKTVTVDFQGDGLLSFDATSTVGELPKDASGKPVSALVTNSGVIRADGGTVLMTARAVKGVIDNVVNTDGIISAQSVGMQNGKIVLSGGDAGTVKIAGKVDATGVGAGQQGGKVVVTGEHVDVTRSAAIDVSGAAGGGEIALGSLGVAPDNGSAAFSDKSSTVKVAAGATLKADALVKGNGGNVTMWSNDATAFAGSLSARGGEQGGDGGFAEVSSKKNIGLTGSVDMRASKGKTGLLLIDPTDLRIVDSGSGSGALDGSAGDGTVNGSDANTANNTVSRGLLESLAGTTNIKLEATGQITIADMAAINLQTTSGNSFTLRSTQTGGIRFENSNTEISTQGGAITLEALGVGSTLNNIGKLTSRGGTITLNATGDINLANVIDAGSGAALVRTSAGNIRNVGGANQVVAGNTVTLDASGGSIGEAGNAVNTQTARLALATGGNLAVANRSVLSTLDITSRHAQPGVNNTYELASSGLTFSLTDNGSYQLNAVNQAGLNFSFTGDRTINVGNIALGTGALALTSTAGDIQARNSVGSISASTIALKATGSTGNNGAIGSSALALTTNTGALTAASGSGGVYVNNLGNLALRSIDTTGALSVWAGGHLTVGAIKAGTSVLSSDIGNIIDDGDDATSISTGMLTLSAQNGGIGAASRALKTNANSVSATSGAGGVYLDSTSGNLTITQAQANNAAIVINGAGALSANNVSSSGGAVNLTGNSIFAGEINAGSGNVTLTARAGNITGSSASLITGNLVTLLAPASNSNYTVGTSGTYLRTAAGELRATGGSIYLNQAQGSVLLDDLKAYNGISVIGVADVTGNKLDAGAGTLWLNAQGGNILRANANSELLGSSINLQAQRHIGTASDHIKTATTSLMLASGGDIYVDNPGKTLTYLSVSNTHADPLRKNVLLVSAPYLAFDVNDDLGTAYELKQVYSSLLNQFIFSGDQSLKLGNIRAGSSVALSSTQGSILDDGIADTRVTANSVTLSANQDIGSATNAVAVNAPYLSLSTRGNLYATDIADLYSLTVTARHKAEDDRYVLDVRAPSLLFNITDDIGGHTIHEMRDSNWVNFNFTGDRDITVGSIDTGYSGSISLNTTGAIRDDGDKSTQLLANSVYLYAGRAIGATGTGYLDILTSNLSGSAGNGGFYAQLPKPTGANNTTGIITLGNITATDAVQIDARQGDLLLTGTVRSWNDDVTLNAANGSILGNGVGSVYAGGSDVFLTATGAIGGLYSGNVSYVGVGGAGLVNVQANAGGDLYLNGGNSNIKLASLTAGGQLGYMQFSGNTTVGSVQANGPASLANSSGSILDDGDAATKIQASSIALSAGGVLGAAGAALTLQAADVSLTSGGDISVDNLTGLTRLAVTRNGSAYGSYAITAPNLSAFTLTDDANGIHLKDIASSSNLDFAFSTNGKNLLVGNVDAGAAGKVSLVSAGNIANDDLANPGAIRAANVSLTAGSSGSIGSSATGGTLALNGTSALSLKGNDFFVDSDTVLQSLAINSLRAAGGTSTIAIGGGAGQTIRITDDGTTQYLEQITGGLTDFSFTGRKNIQVGDISASDLVSLTTAGGGVYSSITSDAGSGRISAGTVKLSATGSDNYTARNANTGAIGSSGRALRTFTNNLVVVNNGDITLHNNGRELRSLDLNLTRRDAYSDTIYDTNAYSFSGLGLQSLSISGGTTLTIAADMPGTALAISADSAITTGTINTGATGSVSLTSRYANSLLSPTISRTSGTITGNSVTLNALGTNGSVWASTNTGNLTIGSAGSVTVANAQQLSSLSLTANHSNTTGAQINWYAISATGLNFSLSDSTSVNGLTLSNVTSANNMALSIASDRALTVNNVATGAGGSVTLNSNNIYGTSSSASSPNITTGELTLNGGSVTGPYNSNQPLYVSVDKLSSNLRGNLWLSNNKTLTLGNNSALGSARVNVTNGSILQGAGSNFVTPSLTLTATGSIGAAGNAVQTDTRQLTTQTGGNLFLNNASNLFSLNVTANHADQGVNNTVQVAAQGLTFNVTDTGAYNLFDVRDTTGLHFSFSGDRTLNIGNIDTGPAHTVSLAANGAGSNLVNLSPTSHVTGDSVSLFATGQIGAGSADKISTTTSELYLTAGSHVYVGNDRDLSTLSLYATGVAPATYDITSNKLLFNVAHNGRLQVNEVRDDTGVNLILSSDVGQDIGIIDTLPTGTVRLSTNGSILGSADDNQRITAGQVSLTAQGTGGIGADGHEINLSAPLLTIQNTGDVYIDSDTHIDSLSLYSMGNGARTYSINSPTRDGQGTIGFTATDGGSGSTAGLVLGDITDAGGLNLSVSSDRNITVGTINVGYDNVSLTARNSSLLGDGDANTKIDAASLTLTANTAIGADGAGNAIDTRVSTLTGRALGGGAYITVEGNTSLPSLTSVGASAVSNTVGDIELGSVNTSGNAFTVNNTGGSILSGTIVNATTVNLTANGSIGNKSAIRTTNLTGGTTTVNLSAKKTDTADGSIALIETYGLRADSVTGDGNITLTADTAYAGRDLVVGTISTSGGAVALTTNRGSIVGADNSNRITGKSVTLTADYGSSRSIGSGNTNRIHLDTPSLTLNTPGAIYVDNLADLTDLTINRNNSAGNQNGSYGVLAINAQNLTFSGADNGTNTALSVVRDTTGLNFTYKAIGSITLNEIDVTSNGSVNLSTNPYYTTGGSIQGMVSTSKITAGDLTLSTAWGNASNSIGSAGNALNTQVNNISATASGGIWLKQAGSINLGNLSAGEDLSVTTTTGDILVGTVTYGTDKTLTLNAQNGSILDGGGAITGSGTGAITLTAKNGIGTNDAAVKIAAPYNPVSATVTGAGSLYLDSTNNLLGGLTTSVANGETRVTSTGSLVLNSMTSATDAAGNGISVKTTSGNITVKNVQAGATQGQITLNAENGYVLADAAGATIKAYGVALNARYGIGANTSTGRINATGQRVEATTNGAMYLAADNNSVYSYLSGSIIDIAAAGNLQIANAIAGNGSGTIKIVGNGTNSQLVAGNIDAGTGSVNIDYSKTGSTIVDDREESTRIIGNSVTLKAGAGIGGAEGSADNLQTTAAIITAEVTGNGSIYLDDNRAAGTTLNSLITQNGAIGITTAGPTLVNSALTKTNSTDNDISIATSNGDLSINTIDAMASGDVTLKAGGSILGALAGNLVYGNSLTATAGGSIGSATNLANGTGGIALRTNVASLGDLTTGADGAVIVLNNVGTRALTLTGDVTQTGDNSSVYLRSSGDLDARSGLSNTADNLLLSSAGTLTVAGAGVQANDTVTLVGTRDVVAAGATPRTIAVKGDTLNFTSGAAGGNTVLTTEVANANVSLTGITAPASLTLNNTGALNAALSTANGNITANATGTLDVSATASGNNRTIDLSSQHGDLAFGLVDAGDASGTVILAAAEGSLLGAGINLTTNSLDLTSKTGIGDASASFNTSARYLTANVVGAGDIIVDGNGALTLGRIATADGHIQIAAVDDLISTVGLSAGNQGDIFLGSVFGNVGVNHAIANTDANNLMVIGAQIGLAAVNTAGSQTYDGDVTLNGDLTGTAIDITGNATLTGGKRTLTANGENGGVTVWGLLNGGGQQAVIVANDGEVMLGGNASNLASLNIDGATIDLQGVTTTGAQQYNGDTTLRGQYITSNGAFGVDGDTVLGSGVNVYTGNGAVTFTGDISGNKALNVNTQGAITYGGAVSTASLNQVGTGITTINGGSVTTTGSQYYTGRVVLGDDTTLTGSTIILANGADGAHALDINGAAMLAGAIGANTKLASLTMNGPATLTTSSIATTGNQHYKNAVSLVIDQSLSTTTGSVTFDGTLDGASNLAITSTAGGDISFNGEGNAGLRLGNVTANTAGATRFNGAMYAASVQTDAPGTVAINASRIDTTGTQTFRELVTLGADTVLKGSTITLAQGVNAADETQGLTIQGDAVINGAVGAGTNARLASLTITGNTQLEGGAINTVGAQAYQGNVTLADDLVLNTSGAAGSNVSFGGTVASTDGDANGLTINAGLGNVTLSGKVGDDADARLGALAINSSGATTLASAVYAASVTTNAGGTLAIDGGLVDTTGTQSYGELAVLGADTVLKGSTVTLAQGADSVDETQALTITGNAVINGALGDNARLASLTISGTADLNGGSIDTVGAQSYQGNVTLSDDLDIYTANSNVTFNGTVASATGETNNLSIGAGNGNVSFVGAVGDGTTARLGDVAINSSGATTLSGAVYAASVTTDAGGTLAIDGGLVDTTGTQSYGELAVLGADTVLKGSTVTLAQGADSVDETQALTIDGNAVVNGALGDNARLAALSITGSADLNGGTINTVGAQSYQGNVTLSDDLVLNTNGAAGSNVSFGGAIASTDGDGHGLTVNAGLGNVTLSGKVGDDANARLGALAINSSGATTLDGAVYAASVTTDAGGTLGINGGLVDTTGAQSYGELAVLGADTVLKGSTVTLAQGADSVDETQGLTIDGNAVVNGALGGGTNARLASLTITGDAELGGGTINTVGAQAYQGNVTLTDDLDSRSANGDVGFGGTLLSSAQDGHGLSLDAGTGNVTFSGAVGDDADGRLGDITIASNGATTLDGAVYAASISTDAGGTLAINGGLVDTTGTQSYGELAVLGADTVLKGSTVSLLGGGDGEHGLTIDGDAVLKGAFGAQDALASLTVNGTSSLDGSIGTTGEQSYNGAVTLDGDVTLATQGGNITFNDKVASSQGDGHDLSLATGAGNVTFTDTVGDDAGGRVGDIRIASSGATTLDGAVYAASITSDVGGTLAINGGLVDTTGTQSYGELAVLGADTVLKGSTVSLLGGADGPHDLTIDGDAVLKGPFGAQDALASLTVNGTSTLGQASIATTGDQSYNGAVTLGGDLTVASRDGDIRFNDAVDGTHDLAVSAGKGNVEFAGPVGQGSRLGDLTIAAAGDTVLDGPVRAASLQTSGNGDVLINGGSVNTTGSQQYGQHVILSGVDTTLTGTNVQIKAGVDGTESGQQGLIIAGNADIQGDIGATTPLRGLAVQGTTTMGPGKVVTTGDQVYAGAVTLTGDRELTSNTGSVVLGSTLDGGNGNNLAINAGRDVLVAGDATGLGSLTLRAVDTIVFNGDVSAYRVQQLEAKSASYNGAVRASGPDGIDISGGTVSFGKDVTADTGAIRIANTDPTGTTSFAAGTTVKAATGFTQTGGAGLTLPAQLLVTQGPINLGAPATLQGATATISTNGDITAVGLSGPQTSLTLATGPLGALRIGLNDANLSHKLDVAELIVPSAGSADVWGTVGGKTGALAASSIKSSLVGSPYYLNGVTWGPTGTIDRLAAITAPQPIIPTTPTADSLFRGTVPSDGFGPDALGAYADPQVLQVATASFNWLLPSGDNAMLNVPTGNNSVLQAPGSSPQQPVAEGNPSSDDERRDNDAQSRTL